jgi:hypothetical protein
MSYIKIIIDSKFACVIAVFSFVYFKTHNEHIGLMLNHLPNIIYTFKQGCNNNGLSNIFTSGSKIIKGCQKKAFERIDLVRADILSYFEIMVEVQNEISVQFNQYHKLINSTEELVALNASPFEHDDSRITSNMNLIDSELRSLNTNIEQTNSQYKDDRTMLSLEDLNQIFDLPRSNLSFDLQLTNIPRRIINAMYQIPIGHIITVNILARKENK